MITGIPRRERNFDAGMGTLGHASEAAIGRRLLHEMMFVEVLQL